MIKQVWVAVHPDDSSKIVVKTKEPNDPDHWFEVVDEIGEWVTAEYKPAMLVMED